MEAIEAIEKLEKDGLFLKWKKENKNAYLVNCFIMMDPQVVAEWQIGYYDKESDRITTFAVGDRITRNPESEVFKKDSIVEPLDLSRVKVSLGDALEKAAKWQQGKYPGNDAVKKIVILQNIERGHVYNITFVTQTFKTLNIKVSSEDGQVKSDKLTSIFEFKK